MSTTSPSKRRALGEVDANARSPLATPRLSPSKAELAKSKLAISASPIELRALKRPLEQENSLKTPDSAKRRRLSDDGFVPRSPRSETRLQKDVECPTRQRSVSPADSSIFDNSTINNSQATAISEPDAEIVPAPLATAPVVEPRRRLGSMTREEARQKAEILRLRLGLAGYKVRTNQADVPLERLQARPLPGGLRKRAPSTVSLPPLPSPSRRGLTVASEKDREKRLSLSARSDGPFPGNAMPIAPSSRKRELGSPIYRAVTDKSPITKPRSEERLPSVVLNTPERRLVEKPGDLSDIERGGAAEGLLSLSQSSPASALR